MHNCQRVQAPLRIPAQVPNFVVRLRLTLFQAALFPSDDFLELPEIFTVDAELFCGIPTGGAELLFLPIPCSQPVLCERAAHSTATSPSTTKEWTSSTPTDNETSFKK